jgi:hypothetical protein
MKERSIDRNKPCIAHHETAEHPEPGEGALPNPTTPLAAPFAPTLMGGPAVMATGRDHGLNPPAGQAGPHGIAVRAPIREQAVGPFAGPAGRAGSANRDRVEGLFEARDLRRGRRRQGLLPAEYPRHRPQPSTLGPSPAWFSRPSPPFVGGNKAAIGKACIPPQLLLVVELGQEGAPALEQRAGLFPVCEPAPTGTGAAIPPGEFTPWGAGPQDPADAFKTAPILDTRPSPAGGRLGERQLAVDGRPLLVAKSSPRPVSPSLFCVRFMALYYANR